MMTNASGSRIGTYGMPLPLYKMFLIVVNMVMSQQIAQTKSHCQVHLQGTEIPILMQGTTIDLHLNMIIETDIDLTGQDPIPIVIDTGVIE